MSPHPCPTSLVSIVIPVYNKWELTQQCLLSPAESTLKTAGEVIVADNASGVHTQLEHILQKIQGDCRFPLNSGK
jgi:glycosyltransferase involved in cell wall biosynthesis